MLAAPIPANDQERLAALRALLILDTPPEERYDKIVHPLSRACRAAAFSPAQASRPRPSNT